MSVDCTTFEHHMIASSIQPAMKRAKNDDDESLAHCLVT